MTLVIIAILVLIVSYLIATYNFFQTGKTRIEASIQEIGNQLKRQADLIPNLEASVKGYLKHEKDILKALADARKQINAAVKSGTIEAQTQASEALSQVLPRLSVIVESNPQLKASETVAKLMEELRDTADKVMYARRTLIDLVADYNTKVVTFPSNLVAKLFNISKQTGLKLNNMDEATTVSSADTKTPKINL